MTLSEELTWRGFANQTTLKDISELNKQKRSFYWGVDPSASSMTIGHLAAAMMVKVFIKHGYSPILLVGGATGLIGDPDGKKQERDLKSEQEIVDNKRGIAEQYKKLFDGQDIKLVDNYDWFKNKTYLDFLRDVGKHVPMRTMLGREFVQSRLKEDGTGISYAEFSYSLIQAYDFLHLLEEYDVTLQLAGADQWGNSIAGVDLIRRKTGKEAHVWTFPLLINKETGVKFGKSEAGAIWLDPERTSPYSFYQYWLNVEDDNAVDYLKIFTQLDEAAVAKIEYEFLADKANRLAQKTLGYEVTKLVHGALVADSVKRITAALFGGTDYSNLTKEDFNQLGSELSVNVVNQEDDLGQIVVNSSLASSLSEARRLVEQKSIYLNGRQITADYKLSGDDYIDGQHAILRRGKNNNVVIKRAA